MDRTALLAEIGLSSDELADPHAHVPVRSLYALWARVARQFGDPSLPFKIARTVVPEDYDVLGYALLTSPSARDAIERLLRYSHVITDSGRWRLEVRGPIASVTWSRSDPLSLGVRLSNELAIAIAVQIMRATMPQVPIVHVGFRHRPPETAPHRAFFRCPVRVGQRADSIAVAATALEVAPRLANPSMYRFFESVMEQRLAERDAPSAATRVRRVIAGELTGGPPTIERVARRLALSERTLRRRLDAEGVSFRKLVEDVRREHAARWLRDTRTSVSEVAQALGFSHPTAFSRAYRRWFGETPRRTRVRR
jgi:AraC-like DNA-binding protein